MITHSPLQILIYQLLPPSSTKSKRNIPLTLTHPRLAPTGVRALRPDDGRAAEALASLDGELLAGEGVAEDVGEVVPDAVAVEGVGEVGLRRARVEAVGRERDLERLAARLGVPHEGLGVAALGRERRRRRDVGAHRPEGRGLRAVVDHAGFADGQGGGDEGYEAGEDGGGEHFWLVFGGWVEVCVWWCFW